MLASSLKCGVDYGTVTVMNVTSMRPNPINLVAEFALVKKKLESMVDQGDAMNKERDLRNAGLKTRAISKKFKYVTATSLKSVEELWNEIIDFSIDNASFYVSAFAASVISAIGLLTNSPVVVLSAMLISPMMGPILSGAFALAIKDWTLLLESFLAELRAATFTFAVGFLSTLIFGGYYEQNGIIPSNEMLSRSSSISLVSGAIIATASGFIVGNAVTSSGVNSLVGVAISASLLPPVVNSGIFVAFSLVYCKDSDRRCSGRNTFYTEASYSLSLYALNVLIIALIAALIFWTQRLGDVSKTAFKRRLGTGMFSLENRGIGHQVLNLSNPHVQKKLKLAAGMDLNVLDEAFDLMKEEEERLQARSNKTQKSESDDDDGIDVESKGTLSEEQISLNELQAEESLYSVLRPFDEPKGVREPEFLRGDSLNSLFKRFRKHLLSER